MMNGQATCIPMKPPNVALVCIAHKLCCWFINNRRLSRAPIEHCTLGAANYLYLCCFCLSRKTNLTFLFRNKCVRKEAVICMLSLLYSLSINSLPGSSGCCSLSDGFYTPKSHQADSIRFPYFLGGRRRKSLGCGRVDMKKTFLGIFLVRAV